MNQVEYSIVVPVYNSEASLKELHERISLVMKELSFSYELIFVNDGSADDSWEVLKEIKASDAENVTIIELSKNFGQHNSTFCGLHMSKGKYILTIDDDLQHPPEEMKKLILARQESEADIVYGIYQKRKHSYPRNLGSKYFKKSSRWLGRPGEGSSFRLISKELIGKILVHHQNFVFIDELLHWYTDRIVYIPVRHDKRKYRKSGYGVRKIWGLLSNIMIYYTTIPLKIMIYGGFISAAFFFVLSVIFAINKIFFDVPLGYTSLIVAILFSTSLILLCLGIIGEYLSRIYMVQNKRPPYTIHKII